MSSKSCSKQDKPKTSITDLEKSFLLEAVPRGGGYLEVSPDLVNSQVEHSDAVKGSKTSCNCAGDSDEEQNNTMTETEWEDADEESELSYGDGYNLLSNLVTVIMLLASGNDATDFQLSIAKDYLECIKDTDGSAPPNIQGLLNHIEMVTEGDDAEEEEDEGEVEETEEQKKVICKNGSKDEDSTDGKDDETSNDASKEDETEDDN